MSIEDLFAEHAKLDATHQKEVVERLVAIEGTLKQYQGFRNGAIFVITTFWVVVATFGKELLDWLRG